MENSGQLIVYTLKIRDLKYFNVLYFTLWALLFLEVKRLLINNVNLIRIDLNTKIILNL